MWNQYLPYVKISAQNLKSYKFGTARFYFKDVPQQNSDIKLTWAEQKVWTISYYYFFFLAACSIATGHTYPRPKKPMNHCAFPKETPCHTYTYIFVYLCIIHP